MSSLNAVVAWAGTAALTALAVLVFGSVLLRLFGIACMIVSSVFLLMEANLNTADAGSYLLYVPMAAVGLVMWVVGHAVHRAQRGWWRSPLAARLAARPERALRRSLQARPPRVRRPHPGGGPVRP
ncbi:MAG: hypothetical protein ABI131_03770 [Nostocoides sp.]